MSRLQRLIEPVGTPTAHMPKTVHSGDPALCSGFAGRSGSGADGHRRQRERAAYPVAGAEGRDRDAEPLASTGIRMVLRRKCEALDSWSCESLAKAIDKGLFRLHDLD